MSNTAMFIRSDINGHRIKTLVDTGASFTMMSLSCAELCGLKDLIDTSLATKKCSPFGWSMTEGYIRNCPINVAGINLNIGIHVDKELQFELLMGVNFLQSNSCVLDFSQNEMRIGSSKTELMHCSNNIARDFVSWIGGVLGLRQTLSDDETDLKQNIEDTICTTTFIDVPESQIKCKINGVALMACVDTGCTYSMMYNSTPEKCGLMDKLDTSQRGLASTAHGIRESMGMISGVSIQLGKNFYPLRFNVFDVTSKLEHLILGNDFIRKNDCILDYGKNKMLIPSRHMRTADKSSVVTTNEAPSSDYSKFIDASKQNLLTYVKETIVRETMNL